MIMKKYVLVIILLIVSLGAWAQNETANKRKSDDEMIYTELSSPPTFPGGGDAFYKFITDNIRYPAEARAKGIQGKVVLVFVIEKNGTLSNFKVLSSPDPELSKEALRVMNTSPNWHPGTKDGKAVRFLFNLPVGFVLEKSHRTKKP